MSLKVSIIIVTRNRANDLRCCLESIQKQNYSNYEVIVLDNGSQDLTETIIKNNSLSNLYYYRASANFGTSYARNVGIRLASGHYIWFLDSDTELLGVDCLSKYVDYFNKKQQLGIIGGEAVVDEVYDVVGVKLQRLRPNGFSRGEHLPIDAEEETDSVTSCNFFTTKEILVEVGGFDLSYFFYLEDVDLSYRIFKTKRKLVVLGGHFVFHKYSRDTRCDGEGLNEAKARLYFVLKEYPFKDICLLPLFDLQMIFKLENFERLKRLLLLSKYRKQATIIRHTRQNSAISSQALFQLIRRVLRFVGSIAFSYVVIIPQIPNILKKRHQDDDFIHQVDVNNYSLITNSII